MALSDDDDGQDFGRLMRDLRKLHGCEALLSVTSDLDTLGFLLVLARQSAVSVASTSERIARRVDQMNGRDL